MNQIDIPSILGVEAPEYLRKVLLSSMNSELAILASSSSTEEDQRAYSRLKSCLRVEISFNGAQIEAKFEINKENLSKDFLKKNSPLIDLVESNMSHKNELFLTTAVQDMMDWPDVQQRAIDEVGPWIAEQFSSMFGGDAS